VRDAKAASGDHGKELQVCLAGRDDAGDGLGEQGADSKDGLGAGPALVQPVLVGWGKTAVA
jgi:hypothetical protein